MRVYNPMTGHEQEIRLNNIERACFFGSAIGSEWRTWRPRLLKRLKLRPGGLRDREEQGEVKERDTVVLDRRVSLKVRMFKYIYELVERHVIFIYQNGRGHPYGWCPPQP